MPAAFRANLSLAHVSRNEWHCLVLLAGLGLPTGFAAWLLCSWSGVLATLAVIAGIVYVAPRLPGEAIMLMYRAKPLARGQGEQLAHLVNVLSRRAGLATAPVIYVIPSLTMNAFTAGTPQKATIGVSEGLLRRLSLRELTGVLSHEFSHIANNDLGVMALADVLTRLAQGLAYVALILAIFSLPSLLLGDSDVSLWALLLLYLAPCIGSLLQLSLSRAREFSADLGGASLSGDPEGLASALRRIERVTGTLWEDLSLPVPGRRIPTPSALRIPPPTEQRLRRLGVLERTLLPPPIDVTEEPMVCLVGLGPSAPGPRLRFPGVWF
jgi:heat shock protein HtpX